MTRARRLPVLVGVMVALGAATGGPASGAATATTCRLGGAGRTLGPSYVTSLQVVRTSCSSGKRLVHAYYRCRLAHGGAKGRCSSRVLGYRCTERRTGISVQFDGVVSCRKGQARVKHTYTQNT